MNDIIFRVIVPDNKILFKTLMLKGERGLQGTSIVSIEKTQTIGLTDYYTITLNDGTTYEFTVQNGTNSYFDDELSLASENAVQNKIITAAINSINAALVSIQQYDNALSLSSENAVQNKVVAAAIDSIVSALALIQQYDSALSDSSENAVQNKVVKAALDLKANLTALNDYYTKSEVDTAFNNLGASNVGYNNTSSGLSATDAQAAIDELAQGGVNPSANNVSYDNTSSGLTANDVQDAIDEVVQDVNSLNADNIPYQAGGSDTIKDKVDDVEASIPTISDLSSGINVGGAFANPDYKKLYKYGKVCHLVFRAKLNSQLADNTSFLSIPASCAPKGNDYAQIIWTGTQYATNTPKNAYFGSWDNSLHNLGSITSGTYIAIDTVWITN